MKLEKNARSIRRSICLVTCVACWIVSTTFGETYRLDEDTGITLPEGFDAEMLYHVPDSQGSWVAMAFDPKGRLIVSDQDDKGIFRLTLEEQANALPKVSVESLKGFPYEPIPWGQRTVGGALGFVYAFDSLYMTTMTGFYRCRDTDGDDQYDQFERLKKLQMGYEHSAHSVIVTEDGKGLYLVSGNYGRIPQDVLSRQPPVWQKDTLLQALPDAMGHATTIKAPGGWISRISPDGKEWTMIASGFRNPVDIALNREGELFTYDSDLEFDIGSPWYRPTRVNHVISGAEFGWRSGTAKWPDYYADSFGSVIDIGPGSPTGLSFGHHSSFPAYYQDKLFLCDWTFGTIYTVELKEEGSSYSGTKKEFLHGQPLNIAAMRFGPDGHMYFVIGGRNTDSKLYRIRYTGPPKSEPVRHLKENHAQRDLRRSLEKFHISKAGGMEAVETAWPHLASSDRAIRYAARLAIENQELEFWQEKVFSEDDPVAVIYSAIALARNGDAKLSARLIDKLLTVRFESLDKSAQLALLRAYSLCCIRLGKPDPSRTKLVIDSLDSHFPADDERLDRELCRVLSYFDSPSIVAKTIELMKATQAKTLAYDENVLSRSEQYGREILATMANTPNGQNIHYAYCLRRVQNGWTLDTRKYYFRWLNGQLTKSGGKSFAGSIRNIREDAIAHLPDQEKAAVAYLLGDVAAVDLSNLPSASGPPVNWTVDQAAALFEEELRGRDFANGKKMFAAGRCIACHRIQGTGGYSGPDLGSVGLRYSPRDILTAIIEPSDSVSEQYQASMVTFEDGTTLAGRIIYHNDEEIAVAQNAFNFGEVTKKPADPITKIEPLPISLMPPGLANSMNAEELKDLMAYLLSGGNARHKYFK